MTNTIPYYPDCYLTPIMKRMRELEKDPGWLPRVMLVRFILGFGVRINEVRRIRVRDCEPDWLFVVDGKGHTTEPVEPEPNFKTYYTWFVRECANRKQFWLFPSRYRIGKLADENGVILIHKRTGAPKLSCISLRTARNWWESVIRECPVPYLPPHDGGRNTYATWAGEDLNLPSLQAQMRHKSYKTTAKHYIGSNIGRRYYQPEPGWKQWARRPEEEQEQQGLRVIDGGRD